MLFANRLFWCVQSPAGLQAKEARMRDLVSLAEKREAACKDEISTLLASRSTMYEAPPAKRACSPPAQAAAVTAATAPEQAAAQEGAQQQEEDEEGCEETLEAAAAKIDEAEKRMEVAQVGCLWHGAAGPACTQPQGRASHLA
jgi:hypothetical protein